MYKTDVNDILTPAKIKKYIDNHASTRARLNKLQDYYLGKHDILNKTVTDTSKPNNKVIENYCSYISDFYSGYFMGDGISYNAPDETMLEEMKQIFRYNDEQEENISVESDASIYGFGAELLYIDKESNIRFKKVDAKELIFIYDNTLEEELLYCIRYYYQADIMDNSNTMFVELYSKNEIVYFTEIGSNLVETSRINHIFGLVPVTVYKNNDNLKGDFEGIITLQDALNKLESYSLDEVEYFENCYMYLVGMEGTDTADIANMKEDRVLLLPENGSAGFLTKQIDDAYITNLKSRITDAIHKISKCPALTDETFATSSGIALKYKLLGFESNTSQKEKHFKKGIQRRIELICSYLNTLGASYDYRDIDITFSRALPTSETELAQIINQLQGVVSQETLLSLLPFVEDAKAEMDKKASESSLNMDISFTGSDLIAQ